jgi:hypothetical protein
MSDEPVANPLFKLLEDNARSLATLQTHVEELLGRVATLPALEKSVADLLDGSRELRLAVSDLRDTQSRELRLAISELNGAQVKMRSEIMDRIDRLQETVEIVRDDVRVNWATADTAINRARSSREEIDDLQKVIAAMERRFQTLASIVDGMRKRGDGK